MSFFLPLGDRYNEIVCLPIFFPVFQVDIKCCRLNLGKSKKWAHFSNSTNWITMEFVAAPCNGLKSFLSDRKQRVLIEWMSFDCANVNSGVPLLFLAYINDLPDMVTSNVKVFADDCVIYKANQPTTQSNKEDLNALGKWKKWLAGGIPPAEMYHHPYLKKRYPIKSIVPTAYSYIGRDLSWREHIISPSPKATRTIEFLRRNLRNRPNDIYDLAQTDNNTRVKQYTSLTFKTRV